MRIVRKILLVLLVLVVLFFLLLIGGALTYKPSFEVRSIGVVDYDGYPCLKISFRTGDYPIEFKLLTKEGESIYFTFATKPEEVVYLYLTPGKPFTNIVGSKSYVIKAFYGDKEVYSGSFDVKGAKADLKIKDASFKAYYSSLSLEGLTIEVRNEGDVPLYLNWMNIGLYLDNLQKSFSLSPSTLTLEPGNISTLGLEPVFSSVDLEYLNEEHRVDVVIPDIARASYIIEPLKPGLRIEKVSLSPFLNEWSVDSITLTISNGGKYPININWLKIYLNDKPIPGLLSISPIEIIKPGEEKTVTLGLSFVTTSRPFTLKVRLGATEASYSG
ncbi:MAG: hypothetical protein DSO07_10105 [Thermoproteota archaeon]|jgi:hypothetical protein|uniref:Uncharacterized protein n=1 Tax=Candidatus Methanodesulfokora washburnensis TaxID=2478471 RepID=A0A3R9X7T3_9CREN|nr:hypothetical protein [Candidatus Methanodesulfokores washburnensis]RSN77415.1 hypothetical protein D6D85_02700 [Candidatus Methanodesulfokores washburnensis]TDA39776.1 MAG: hypothetical protein DSO07_10105 [Candidatus Korarchaeota archaeon]